MIFFFRFLFGYVDFTFTGGFKENFITKCFAQGIEIRDISNIENGIKARCRASVYKKLHHIAFEEGGVVRIVKKHGLPFIAAPLRNRVGLAAGALAFVMIVALLNSFVWRIEVVGNETVSETSVLDFLEQNNLKSGTLWSSVDRDKLYFDMMGEFEQLSWVHINKDGAVARVEILENTPEPEADEDKLKGINVFRRELTVVINRKQSTITLSSIKSYKRFHFFGLNIPLYINYNKGNISSTSTKYLTVKGTELPIGIETIEEKYFDYSDKDISDSQMKNLAKKQLKVSEEQEFYDFEIVNKSEKFDIDDNMCTLRACYIIRRK